MAGQIVGSKRKAIADSSRTMFIWVAAMSAVVGVCAVVSVFLIQQIAFKAGVVKQVTDTANTLANNNKVAGTLASNVVVLETNNALNSIKADPDEKALAVVLDSLPSERNPLALGGSLQQKLLSGIDGLTVEGLSVDSATIDTAATPVATNGISTIPIQIQVSSSSVTSIQELLKRLEKSIRIIDVDGLVIERGDSTYQATITAHAYYQPAKQVQLTTITCTPKKGCK